MPAQFPALQQRGLAKFIKLALNFSANETLDPRITFSRTSNATRVNAQGLIEYAPHNLLTNSENFDNASWTKNTATVSANYTTAPDGATTADLITSTGADGYFGRGQSGVNGNQQYTASIYLRSDIPTTVRLYLLETVGGTNTSYTICNITTQWQRFSVSITTGSTVTSISSQVGGANTFGTGKAIYAWGAQLNIGSLQPYYTTSVKNLLGYSQEFSNAVWTKSNSTIDATPVMGPFGYLGAMKLVEDTTNAPHYIRQFPSITTPVAFSVYAKAGERTKFQLDCYDATNGTRNAVFNLVSGTVETILGAGVSANIIALSNGWYRCCMILPTSATGGDCKIALYTTSNSYLGDGTSGIYIFGAQLSDSASLDPYSYNFGAAPTSTAYYGPRFDYDPVTLAPKGLLIEESRTNLLTYSSEFDNAIWSKVAVAIATNQRISPDGTLSMDTITLTGGAGYLQQTATTTSTVAYNLSIFVYAASNKIRIIAHDGATNICTVTWSSISANTNTVSGIAANVTSTLVGNNIYRLSFSFIASSTTTNIRLQCLDSVGNPAIGATGDFWGAQLESGSFPTSYIPTTSAQVTRTADNASMVGTNFSSWYNQSEGTIYSEWMLGGDNTSVNVYNINDSTGANYIRNRYNSAGSGNDNAVGVGGIVQVVLNAINQTTTYSSYKNAMSYKQSDFARSSSGTLITNASGNIPTVTQINLGGSVVFGVESLNGHIQSFKYFNKRLLNSYLQSLTQ